MHTYWIILILSLIPIDTNQHNPTKINDGCQEIIKILADKKKEL